MLSVVEGTLAEGDVQEVGDGPTSMSLPELKMAGYEILPEDILAR